MELPSLPESLKRGAGRRILGFFLLAGIVPVIFTAGFAYQEIGRAAEQEIGATLRQHGKDFGLDALGRLQRMSLAADTIARVVEQEGEDALTEHDYLFNDFETVWYAGSMVPLYGDPANIAELDLDAALRGGDAVSRLATLSQGAGAQFAFLRQFVRAQGAERILAITPKPQQLWGANEDLPYATDFCVFTRTGVTIHCSREEVARHLVRFTTTTDRAPLEWTLEGEGQLAATWQLFLAGSFGAPAIDIVVSQPALFAFQSRADFRRIFVPALGLVIILIGLLSFTMIGQSLEPLRQLTAATQQIAAGDFFARVRIATKDEFEMLGNSFNNMAAKLGRQFDTLEAMSSIDRLILSGASFEQVAERVVEQLMQLTDFAAAAVVARDADTPHWAKMIASNGTDLSHERIALPVELGHESLQLRQVELATVGDSVAPYKECFLKFELSHVVLIPVILNGEAKGMLLLGSASQVDLDDDSLRRCADIAGRFAVALSSAEREEALYRQAHFDDLTGLPNRQLLKDRLDQYLVLARRDQQNGAVLYLDLDRFKEINDVFGHSVGDIVLIQAAERILSEVRDSDTVARLGGDEFVVIMPNLEADDKAHKTATRLLSRLSESFSVHGEDHYVSASIGVVLFPDDGESVETLLKNADAAMYRAKDAGRGRFEFFSRKLNAESRRKINLERDLRSAKDNDELQIFYQPQLDFASGDITGAEALLRWHHADEGFIAPSEFVPLAEDSDLIIDIGRWVIEQTCRDLRAILDDDLHPGSVSINVSTRQLRDGRIVGDVIEQLHRFDIHPGYLQLEVTETTLAQNRDTVIDLLSTLRARGVRIAIDDFGTGFSSLSYLQHLPFDVIKIDKSFVDRLGSGDPADNICRTIIKMAHELGKKAVAEGVELECQADFLKSYGCDAVQGYYYSEPLPINEFTAFVAKQDFHTQRRKALEIVQ